MRRRLRSERLSLLGCVFAVLAMGCGGSADTSLAAPTDLVALPVDSQWVQLSWVDNATAEEGFRIYRDGGSGFVEIDTVPADNFGYSDLTVVDGEVYTYYVAAFDSTDEGSESNHATVEAGPPYITILTPAGGENLTLGDTFEITWVTNLPEFDARIFLDTDGGAGWPPEHLIQYSYTGGPPYQWKVGYINTEEDPQKPPVWQRVINSTDTDCKIFIRHYATVGAQDWSEGTFTITVP